MWVFFGYFSKLNKITQLSYCKVLYNSLVLTHKHIRWGTDQLNKQVPEPPKDHEVETKRKDGEQTQ